MKSVPFKRALLPAVISGSALAFVLASPVFAEDGGMYGERQRTEIRADSGVVDSDARVSFSDLDLNNDGVISVGEAAVSDSIVVSTTHPRFSELDLNGDGVISRDEAMASERLAVVEPMPGGMYQSFSAIDLDGDGEISKDEADASGFIAFESIDVDKDDTVTEYEFSAFETGEPIDIHRDTSVLPGLQVEPSIGDSDRPQEGGLFLNQ